MALRSRRSLTWRIVVKEVKLRPPTPTTHWRIPFGSGAGSTAAALPLPSLPKRSYVWSCPARATSTLLSRRISHSVWTELVCRPPEDQRGACQYARKQFLPALAARSLLSQLACGDVEPQPPTREQFEFSA